MFVDGPPRPPGPQYIFGELRGSDPSTAPQTFSVGGTVSGLATSGLTLSNGADLIEIAANAATFSFPVGVPYGSKFDLTIQSQPGTRDEYCALNANTGVVATSDINSVSVTCHPTQWVVTRLAGGSSVGSADGPASTATFFAPEGLAVAAGGTIYVVGGNKVRKISPDRLIA